MTAAPPVELREANRWARAARRALLVAAAAACTSCRAEPNPPNVVVLLSDTLRRDHLSVYGYARPTSPQIDAFAADATLYTNAFAQSSSTKASVASLFTSLYPTEHQVIRNPQGLPGAQVTLAEILRDAGHATAAFVENSVIGAQFGFSQGFDEWTFDNTRHSEVDEAMDAFDEAIVESIASTREKPFFLYVHYIDPHNPYLPPDSWKRRFHRGSYAHGTMFKVGDRLSRHIGSFVSRYDEEIAYVDHRIGRVLAAIDSHGLRDDTLVIFLSDHGEGFLEHGRVHHSYSVHGELINIPLVIRYPGGQPARRVNDFVTHVDILPTILDVVGIERAGMRLSGRSLVGEGSNEPLSGVETPVISEHLRGNRQRAIMSGDRKLILDIDTGRRHLYDLEADPLDVRPLSDPESQQRSRQLERELKQRVYTMARRLRPDEVELDEETRRSLKALGYMR